MKPWLLNILACPIDKHHPLDVYFYKYSSEEQEAKNMQDEIKILAKQIVEDVISPVSIQDIHDLTGDADSSKKYEALLEALPVLVENKSMGINALMKDYSGELTALYEYLNLQEVEEGLLYCQECGRSGPRDHRGGTRHAAGHHNEA